MDQHLNHCHQTKPLQYPTKFVQNRPLICYRKYINDPEGIWKIALPTAIIDRVVTWYHEVLGHCGTNRLYDTIRQHFYYPNLRIKCEEYQCEICQKNKLLGAGYGHLPPRHANLVPWEEVMVDLIGPWKVKVNEQDIYFNALTCIDPVTNLVEMIRLENKTSNHVAQQFENCWLNQYPRPNKCIHDKGGEFIGPEFQSLLARADITDSPTTSRNPQANSVCERLHQTVANILRTTVTAQPPRNAHHFFTVWQNTNPYNIPHLYKSRIKSTYEKLNYNGPIWTSRSRWSRRTQLKSLLRQSKVPQ